MAKPFDATTKQIVEVNPQDWLELLGLPRLRAEVIDADLSAVTTDADRILRIIETPPRLFHFEFEAGRDTRFVPQRAHRYNALIDTLYDLPVATTVFLLNHRASHQAEVTGFYERTHPDTGNIVQFWYRVVRVWELPVQNLLSGGVATLPLALLADMAGAEPDQVVSAMHARITADSSSQDDAETLLTAAYILAGLRFPDRIVQSLFQGVLNMEESSTYQAILLKGEARGEARGEAIGKLNEARRLLVLAGRNRLGEPTPKIQARIEAIHSIERLEMLIQKIYAVESWGDLLSQRA